jgi:glutamate-1-semialdehyde 2,1-aminomutase
MVPMLPEYADMLNRVTRAVGAVLIADEVISLRLGPRGGQHRFGLEPDLTTTAKMIGGGFPVACVAGTADAMSVFDHRGGKPRNPSSGTFTANPIGLTAGLAAMQLLTAESFDRLEALGERARAGILAAFRSAGYPGQVTGVGSMFQVHLHTRPITDYRSAYAGPQERAAMLRLQTEMLTRGVIISNKGFAFLSTVNTEADIEALTEALEGALRALPDAHAA